MWHPVPVAFLILFLVAAASSATALHEIKKAAVLEDQRNVAVKTLKENQKEIVAHENLKRKNLSLPDRDLDKRLDRWLRD